MGFVATVVQLGHVVAMACLATVSLELVEIQQALLGEAVQLLEEAHMPGEVAQLLDEAQKPGESVHPFEEANLHVAQVQPRHLLGGEQSEEKRVHNERVSKALEAVVTRMTKEELHHYVSTPVSAETLHRLHVWVENEIGPSPPSRHIPLVYMQFIHLV